MKKQWTVLAMASVAMGLFLISSMTVSAEGDGLRAPSEAVTIDGKKPVKFQHSVHTALGLECGACHHDAEHQPRTKEAIAGLESAAELACVSCHNQNFANKKLQKKKDVFHARCKVCHKAGVEGKKGPVKCSGCHVKTVKKSAPAIEGC